MSWKLGIWVKQKYEIYVFNYWLLFLWVILNNFNFILKILFAIVNNWFGLFATHSFTNSNFREYFCLTKSIEKYQRRFVSISKIHNWTKLIDTICENYPQVSYPILHSCYLLSNIIGLSLPGTFQILIGKFSYFLIRFLNHIFFVIYFSYFVIRFLLYSSIVKSDHEIGKFLDKDAILVQQHCIGN